MLSNVKIYNVYFIDNGLIYYIKENFNNGIMFICLCILGYMYCVNIDNDVFNFKDVNNNVSNIVFYFNGMMIWKIVGIGVFM